MNRSGGSGDRESDGRLCSNSSPSSSPLNKSDAEKSIVGKFKSHVSGIINNTPLSKWFNRSRRRDDEDDDQLLHDDELIRMQPPLKRAKRSAVTEDEPSRDVSGALFTNHLGPLSSTPLASAAATGASSAAAAKKHNFPEPIAGPSGVKSRKQLSATSTTRTFAVPTAPAVVLNGHKESDSEESTSGYSSVARISSKEQVFESRDSSKQTSPLENSPTNSRSLFNKSNNMTRTLFGENSPRVNASLSSRRPSFNVSTFGSPQFVDKTLSTRRLLNSPFYNGRTTYGGASAYSRRLATVRASAQQQQRQPATPAPKASTIKPVNKQQDAQGALGKTAQRILNTLEQYSSPIGDAKKMPGKRPRPDPNQSGGMLTKYIGANPYLVRDSAAAAAARGGGSNSELQVPSVSDLLKMKQCKERLQDSTESVRQLAASSKSSLNAPPPPPAYKIANLEAGDDRPQEQQHKGKMKTKLANVRQKAPQLAEESCEEVAAALVAVPLPITSLPKIDFTMAPPAASLEKKVVACSPAQGIKFTSVTLTKAAPSRAVETTVSYDAKKEDEEEESVQFKFSKPLVIAEINLSPLVGINNYIFNPPISKKARRDEAAAVTMPTLNFKMPESSRQPPLPKAKNNGDAVKVVGELKTGSVMDILGKGTSFGGAAAAAIPAAKAEKKWECSMCWVQNEPAKSKCVACDHPKAAAPAAAKPALPLHSSWSAPGGGGGGGKWECDACFVKNVQTASKCIACETPKAGAAPAKSLFPPPALSSSSSSSLSMSSSSKPWECEACWVMNKPESVKCIACDTAKPGAKQRPPSPRVISNSFGDQFKKKASEWECELCMVKNDGALEKCQCCEAPNPKAAKAGPTTSLPAGKSLISSFNFGVDAKLAATFNFGIPAEAKTEPPTSASSSFAASVFGESAKAAPASAPASFSFGVPAAAAKPNEEKKTEVKVVAEVKPVEEPKKTEPAPMFSFGAPKTTTTAAISTPATSETKPLSFEFKSSVPNGDVNKPTTTTPAFGIKADPPKASSAFGNAAPTFSFGAKPAAPAAPAAVAEPAKPLFQFGGIAPKKDEVLPSSSTSLFGGTPKAATNGFGAATSAPTIAATPAPSFSSSTSSGFGSTTTFNASPAPKSFSFGGTNAAVAPAAAEAPKPAMFSFGSASAQPPAKPQAGRFNFSAAAAAAPPPAAGGFDFSAAPKQPSFGSNGASTTGQGVAFNFGSNMAAANNNNQKAVLSFGGSSTFNAPAAAAAVPATPMAGGFGAAPAAAGASGGGFNFGAALAAPPTFGGGAPAATAAAASPFAFNAPPAQQQQQQQTNMFSVPPSEGQPRRKLARAVRRTAR